MVNLSNFVPHKSFTIALGVLLGILVCQNLIAQSTESRKSYYPTSSTNFEFGIGLSGLSSFSRINQNPDLSSIGLPNGDYSYTSLGIKAHLKGEFSFLGERLSPTRTSKFRINDIIGLEFNPEFSIAILRTIPGQSLKSDPLSNQAIQRVSLYNYTATAGMVMGYLHNQTDYCLQISGLMTQNRGTYDPIIGTRAKFLISRPSYQLGFTLDNYFSLWTSYKQFNRLESQVMFASYNLGLEASYTTQKKNMFGLRLEVAPLQFGTWINRGKSDRVADLPHTTLFYNLTFFSKLQY